MSIYNPHAGKRCFFFSNVTRDTTTNCAPVLLPDPSVLDAFGFFGGGLNKLLRKIIKFPQHFTLLILGFALPDVYYKH